MMGAIAFDTLKFAKRLIVGTGLTEAQAEAITEIQQAAASAALEQARHDYHLDEPASRRDLKELELAVKKDVEVLPAETKQSIAETKAELMRWVCRCRYFAIHTYRRINAEAGATYLNCSEFIK